MADSIVKREGLRRVCSNSLRKEFRMPKDRGYLKGRAQSSVVSVVPMPVSKSSVQRKGKRKTK